MWTAPFIVALYGKVREIHYLTKSTEARTSYLPWAEFFFAFFMALLGTIELIAYKEIICGIE